MKGRKYRESKGRGGIKAERGGGGGGEREGGRAEQCANRSQIVCVNLLLSAIGWYRGTLST